MPALYHAETRQMCEFVKVQTAMTNVKEFREEKTTLNLAIILSKNLDHLKDY
jgi:hypothetical protein